MGCKTETKRVLTCSFTQESNCFNPVPTPITMFGMTEKDVYKARWYKAGTSAGGIVTTLEDREDVETVYSIAMNAPSGAPVQGNVWHHFVENVLADIKAAGSLDGVAISLHGATMAEDSDDVCGEILSAIRNAVGETVPIAAAFDLHANITEKVQKNADYICGYWEYPHVDQFTTGRRAATMLLNHLDGKPAKTVAVRIPMIAPAHGYTTNEGGLFALVNKAKEMVSSGRLLDYTIFEVQPWLDTKEMASCIITIAEDEEIAGAAAKELALENFALRKELIGAPLTSVADVIQKALDNKTGKPIILVDSSDSRGAGSTADSAAVLEALLPYADRLRCAVGVSDAPAAQKAFALGVGARADFTLGATVAPLLSKPVEVKNALVRSLHEGHFTFQGPIWRGGTGYCGKVAVLQVGKILIQVSTDSRTEGDRGFYCGFGIDPQFCDLVSVKACTSFRAGYAPIAAEICNTATPGAAGTVLTELPYRNRPVPMYPFEEIDETDITEPVCYR